MLFKKAIVLGSVGFVIGAMISAGFGLMYGATESIREVLPHLFPGGLYGAVAMGSTVFYDIEKWSIARATATHFLLVVGLYCVLVFTMGWFRIEDPVFWIVISIMVVGYILIWLFQYLSYKRKIQQMNNELQMLKAKTKPSDRLDT